jgi:Flp pilus assembly protein TadD
MMSIPQAFALACLHHQAGRWPQAEQICRRILELDANQVDTLYLLGIIAVQTGRAEQGIAYLQQVLYLRPDFAAAHNNLGYTLLELGRPAEAELSLRQALRLRPDYAEALNNLGISLRRQGRLAEAVGSLEQALRLRPEYAEAHNNLGNSLKGQGRLAEAVVSFERALRLKPDYAEAHNNLGATLQSQGLLSEATAHFHQAIRLRPTYPDAHYSLGMFWLLQGNFEKGWPAHEWRLQKKDIFAPQIPGPRWDGSSLEGKTILLIAEQGLGDTLQFIRYAPLVKRRDGRVLVWTFASLVPLLRTCPGIERVFEFEEPLPRSDVHAHLLSLPFLLKTTNIPADVPYLSPDPERLTHWRHEVSQGPGLRIGIVWQGRPGHLQDRLRSVALMEFAPLARWKGIRLFSLQLGTNPQDVSVLKDLGVTDLGSRFDPGSFADAAAVVMNLDLVVTVDTALAHLAGALGRPVWVALPFIPDWRWMLDREDSPWYPTMRLFRQTRPGNWTEVFERLGAELRALIEKRGLAGQN